MERLGLTKEQADVLTMLVTVHYNQLKFIMLIVPFIGKLKCTRVLLQGIVPIMEQQMMRRTGCSWIVLMYLIFLKR
jgi:hypothetical protein